MIESLHQSIEDIQYEDFTGQWKTDIYLDPESQKLYTFTNTGGIPMDVYHGIDVRILTVNPGAIAESDQEETMKKCDSACPSEDTEESVKYQNYGCLPCVFEIRQMLANKEVWMCHSNQLRPCIATGLTAVPEGYTARTEF